MSLVRITGAFLLLALCGAPLHAQSTGAVAGCVVHVTSSPLPGSTVLAWTPQRQFTTVADDKGCYAFEALPPDVYTIEAHLIGFTPMTRADVRVERGTFQRLNFWLTLGGICECLPVPENLRDIWQRAVAIVHVRIDRIDTAVPPTEAVRQSAVVLEVFKRHPDGAPTEDRIAFVVNGLQDQGRGQSNDYALGNEFIMFFENWQPELRAFVMDCDQPWAMAVDGSRMVRVPFRGAGEIPLENLLAQLRTFAGQ